MTCLEQIGLILKEQRQELKMSLAAMSEKTKLSIVQLEAIEEGNIEFFKDDLSYLSYFVRYYANALGLDFNEIRDELDDSIMDFTSSISVSRVKQKEEMNQRVIHKTQQHRKKARKNIDYSSVALFLLTALILVLVGFAIVKVVLPSLQSMGNNEPPVVEVPGAGEENLFTTNVVVATSDLVEQWLVFQRGASRKSANDLYKELQFTKENIKMDTKEYNLKQNRRIPALSEEQEKILRSFLSEL